MMLLAEALSVLPATLELVPVAGKRPVVRGWEKGLDRKQLARQPPELNVGLLARHRPGLDIDVTDPDCASAIQFAAEMELGLAPVRIGHPPKRLLLYRTDAPFGKIQAFLRAPDGSTKNSNGKEWAIELLGDGQFFVVEGVHPGTGDCFTWNCQAWWEEPLVAVDEAQVRAFFGVLPDYLPAGWQLVRVTGGPRVASDRDLLALAQQPLDGWDENRVIDEIVPYLDLECHYDDWLKAGQALHHQGGGADEWFDLWDSIFEGSSKYAGPEYGREKWASFGGYDGRQITLATLIHETREPRDAAKAVVSASVVGGLLAQVEAASDAAVLETSLAADVRRAVLLDVDRERLVEAIRLRAVALGVRVTAAVVRRWVRPPRGRGAVDVALGGDSAAPGWTREWVFCANGDKFFSLRNKQLVTSFGFRAIHNRLMPVDPNTGARMRADAACLEQWGMPVVDNLAYVPWAGPVFGMNGAVWGNLYRDDLVPDVPVELTREDDAAVAVVLEHAERMFPDARERELFLSWCAWQVQRPGEKVRWAPYLCGVEGDGKSFWATAVGLAMGQVNVRSLTAKVLESGFTDWATGAAVIVLEEMKQHGHNRYDVMNTLKPMITNEIIEIHPKGRAPYMSPNTASYLLLSNFMDGAPVAVSDRRYMFLRSAIGLDEVRAMSAGGYFDRLFGAVRGRPGAIRAWLLGYSLHPEFSAEGRAPDTAVREAVIEAVKSETETLIDDVIDDEGFGDTLVYDELVTALKLAGGGLADRSIGAALGRKGYNLVGRFQLGGKRMRVWSKRRMGVDEARTWAAARINGPVPGSCPDKFYPGSV